MPLDGMRARNAVPAEGQTTLHDEPLRRPAEPMGAAAGKLRPWRTLYMPSAISCWTP